MDLGIWMLVVTCLSVQQACLGSVQNMAPRTAIIRGSDALPGEFKWMVSLQDKNGRHFCGGVVISHKAILTAAHYLYLEDEGPTQRNSSDFTVLLGTHDLSTSGRLTIIDVRKYIVHPGYRNYNRNKHFDIAVLELQRSINSLPQQFRDKIAVIQLTGTRYLPRDLQAMGQLLVLGWGFLADKKLKTTLQKARVSILTYPECEKRFNGSFFNVTSSIYCTESTTVDVCQGDSGGPLAIERSTTSGITHELVGIISMSSNGCARTGSASIYSKVDYFKDFIQAEMRRIE